MMKTMILWMGDVAKMLADATLWLFKPSPLLDGLADWLGLESLTPISIISTAVVGGILVLHIIHLVNVISG